MSKLSPFRINTSKNFQRFCISLICSHLKSSPINTSVIFDFKLPRINTSEKSGGRGVQFQQELQLGIRGQSVTAADKLAGRECSTFSLTATAMVCVAQALLPVRLCTFSPRIFPTKKPQLHTARSGCATRNAAAMVCVAQALLPV